MSTSDCPTCGRPMSPIAVVCPHCGSRRADRDPIDEAEAAARAEARAKAERKKPRPVLSDISKEEAAALLAANSVDRPTRSDPPVGAFASVLLPSPNASGGRLIAEVALTILAMPLLLGTLLSLLRMWPRHGHARSIVVGPGSHVAAAGIGAVGIYYAGPAFGWSSGVTWAVIAVSGGALLLRMAIRSKA